MLNNLSNFPILFVDDDELWLENTIRGLKILGLKKVEGCSNPLQVLDRLKSIQYKLIVIDLWMPQKPGEILLSEIKQHYPDIPVIVITADNQVDTAVKCMQNGAANFLTKPIEPNKVITYIKQIIKNTTHTTISSNSTSDNLNSPVQYYSTLTQTSIMQNIFNFIDTNHLSALPILITGEAGCGKSNMAYSIYKAYRRTGNFAVFDFANIDNQEYFFDLSNTESIHSLISANNNITIYFKNIDLLTTNSQYSLLNLFQNIQDEYHSSLSNVLELPKFILSSKINIINENTFIPDLNFILKIEHIIIPPLRERIIDIPLLFMSFINKYISNMNINMPHIPKELLPLLEQYHFPGNIQELEDMFKYALDNCNRGKLSMESFKEHMDLHRDINSFTKSDNIFSTCKVLPTLKESQLLLLLEALKRSNGNQAHAAHLLGITRQGLNKKIQSFNIKI